MEDKGEEERVKLEENVKMRRRRKIRIGSKMRRRRKNM